MEDDMTANTNSAAYASIPFGSAGGTLGQLLRTLKVWNERAASRRALRALEDRELKDIGLSRIEALQEAAKPFWRP